MTWRAQIDDHGTITRYKDTDSGEVISAKEYEHRQQMPAAISAPANQANMPQMTAGSTYSGADGGAVVASPPNGYMPAGGQFIAPSSMSQASMPQAPQAPGIIPGLQPQTNPMMAAAPTQMAPSAIPDNNNALNPLIQPGAKMLQPGGTSPGTLVLPAGQSPSQPPTAGQAIQGKNLRMEGIPHQAAAGPRGYKAHGFLDATSIAILLPTLVLLALIIAAAHKKRLFPWQTIRTFNPPSGLMSMREYERSFLCPPNLRRHGRLGKRNPNATWVDQDGVVLPFGFLARTHLPVTIPLGRLPNKNMFIVAPSGSGKTTLMRAIIKALLAKPCVIIALEAKANDPNLDERREGFKYSLLPEAQHAGFDALYFNPLDTDSVHWNPLDLDPITFASSIVQDVNSLPPEDQHWAERDHGYISGLVTCLKWGAVMVSGEDETGMPAQVQPLPCNPRGLMRLVNSRRNIVESLRRLKNNPDVEPGELNELTQMLSSIIRTDADWDKNIQGVRGRLRMFKNPNVLRVTENSNIDMLASMHKPTVLIFGAPASLGPDAESLAACFVYQLQQALHTRYGTASVLPLFAFFDEYQTLNMDIAGRLSAIVRGANGGLAIILQNISQIISKASSSPDIGGMSELKTIFSNSAVRVCLHNADESTAKFFSDEIGKHAVIVPGISDHYQAGGFGIFPSTWNRIHSQQVISRVDTDSIKRMEKQHALVYLSPAGDPEFGETKPFMVDLRGIEEIAKLHLLHNVGSRQPQAVSEPPTALNPQPTTLPISIAPTFNAGEQAQSVIPQGIVERSGLLTPEPINRLCPYCKQVAGKGRFCIECGKLLSIPPSGTAPVLAETPTPVATVEAAIANMLQTAPNKHIPSFAVPAIPGAILKEMPEAGSKTPTASASNIEPPEQTAAPQQKLPPGVAASVPSQPAVQAPPTVSPTSSTAQTMSVNNLLPQSESISMEPDPAEVIEMTAVTEIANDKTREHRPPLRSLNPDPSTLNLPSPQIMPGSDQSSSSASSGSTGSGIEF